jgi:hypothetical protein
MKQVARKAQGWLTHDVWIEALVIWGTLASQTWCVHPSLPCRTPLSTSNWTGQSQSHSYFTTGSLPSISLSWQQAPWDPWPQFLFASWTLAVIILIKRPLWLEDGFVIYNWCWYSPAQSFSGLSPMALMATFYYFSFKTPSTWSARSPYLYPPGTG